jgi:propionyl-CoA carboxylase alpha chain
VDSGIEEGSEISIFYDPMIAKLVTWGKDRSDAIAAMQHALEQFYIRGVETNLPFVLAIMDHPRFRSGEITTRFIEEEYPDGFDQPVLQPGALVNMVCVLTSIHFRLTARAATISNQVPGYARNVESSWAVVVGQDNYDTEVRADNGGWAISFEGDSYRVEDNWLPTEAVYAGSVNGYPVYFQVEKNGYGYDVSWSGNTQTVHVLNRQTAEFNKLMPQKAPPDLSGFLLSPMPGLLVSVSVSAGDAVKTGQELAVIEAMKMENSLRAEQGGIVESVLAETGATLEVDQPILQFESRDTD